MPDENGGMTPEEMFNKHMEDQQKIINARQQQQQQPQPPQMPTGQPGEPPVLDSNEQRVLNELQNTTSPVVSTGSHPVQVSSSLPQCPQCGLLHPPNADGKPCLNAPVQAVGSSNVVDLDMEINKYLVSLKNIALSQVQSKGIKDINKLLQYMTIEMTKLLEGYNE